MALVPLIQQFGSTLPNIVPNLTDLQTTFHNGFTPQPPFGQNTLASFQGQTPGLQGNTQLLGLDAANVGGVGLGTPNGPNLDLAGVFAAAQQQQTAQSPSVPPTSFNGGGSVGFKTSGGGDFSASQSALNNVGGNVGNVPVSTPTAPPAPTVPTPVFNQAQQDAIRKLVSQPEKSALAQGFDLAKTGTDILGGLASIYFGSQGLKEARKQFEFNRGVTNRNLANRAASVNQDLGARFRRTLQSSTGQPVDFNDPRVQEFVRQNGANGSAI